MAEEIKDTEVKEETAEVTAAAEKAEETLAMKKLTALKEFADAHEISGLQYLQINEANLLVNTRLLVEGQMCLQIGCKTGIGYLLSLTS